jgi:hypothetical protein
MAIGFFINDYNNKPIAIYIFTLVLINGYYILMDIGEYFVIGYLWLLVVIGGYHINDY